MTDSEFKAARQTIREFRDWLREARDVDPDWASEYTRMIQLIDSLDHDIHVLRTRNDDIRAKLQAKWSEWQDA